MAFRLPLYINRGNLSKARKEGQKEAKVAQNDFHMNFYAVWRFEIKNQMLQFPEFFCVQCPISFYSFFSSIYVTFFVPIECIRGKGGNACRMRIKAVGKFRNAQASIRRASWASFRYHTVHKIRFSYKYTFFTNRNVRSMFSYNNSTHPQSYSST